VRIVETGRVIMVKIVRQECQHVLAERCLEKKEEREGRKEGREDLKIQCNQMKMKREE
jgi:hypothetical protein